jgi:excisionase family DNA binding protein
MPAPPGSGRYATVAEVAAVLRVSKMTVYRLIRTHTLASVRIGKSYRVPVTAMNDYITTAITNTARLS